MTVASMSGYHWLASYPKSGNTWLRLALDSLRQDGASPDFAAVDKDFSEIASDRVSFDLLLDVDSAELSIDETERLRPAFYRLEIGRCAGPQVRKVHDAWTRTSSGEPLFPPALTLAAIYVVRDPRDVAVSFAHHNGQDLDRTIQFMGRANAGLGSGGSQLGQRLLTWSRHVRSWLDAPVPTMLLRYEDMLAHPAGTLAGVARHLGWEVSTGAIERAAAATRFEALRAAEERHGFPEKPGTSQRFFRRGVAGGWRDSLSPAQAARIEDDHGEVMAELGYV